ncbi:hypothetical protein ACFE04_011388 [Oxalis oulophora]
MDNGICARMLVFQEAAMCVDHEENQGGKHHIATTAKTTTQKHNHHSLEDPEHDTGKNDPKQRSKHLFDIRSEKTHYTKLVEQLVNTHCDVASSNGALLAWDPISAKMLLYAKEIGDKPNLLNIVRGIAGDTPSLLGTLSASHVPIKVYRALCHVMHDLIQVYEALGHEAYRLTEGQGTCDSDPSLL